jgi:CDP-glycerol glycerophosphotransferase (TagB/SpsB family)
LRARFDKRAFQRHYSIDLTAKVVLLGLTWHHGGSLGHWGDEEQLLDNLVTHITARGASVLLRMHDRQRYSTDYQRLAERLAARHAGKLMLKWKSEAPDSLVDLLVSDVCISNYSSLLNTFYYTERPTLHIDPHDAEAARQTTFTMFFGRPMRRTVKDADQLWKLPPEENGGLHARSFSALLEQVELALSDPTCCQEQARSFIARYIREADGSSCERIRRYLEAWATGDAAAERSLAGT